MPLATKYSSVCAIPQTTIAPMKYHTFVGSVPGASYLSLRIGGEIWGDLYLLGKQVHVNTIPPMEQPLYLL